MVIAASALILLLVMAGAVLTFRSPSSPTTNGETTANFADLNAAAPSASASDADMNSTDMNLTADLAATSGPTDWSYFDSSDQVRGSTIYHAAIDSENSAYFDFPYGGGSTLTMTVRKHPSYGDDVIFKISKGQILCHVYSCEGTINFGSGPESIGLSEPDDNSSDTLFAQDGLSIINRLKSAKKVIVELPFYQEGNRQFIFETPTPLHWPPKGSEPPTTRPRPTSAQPVGRPDSEPTDEELNQAFPPQR
jgi:hypothetical protein